VTCPLGAKTGHPGGNEAAAPIRALARIGATYLLVCLQPQEGAQLCGALVQLQGLQLQLVHLQASLFTGSTFVIVISLALVADKGLSKVCTMVRSQA
jgi:hypothetical protein